MVHLTYTYMCFHRMQEITSTAMEAITPIAADRPRVTLIATTLWWEKSSQLPHTGRQSEVFSTVVQEKPSRHWSVLQFSCWTPVGGWMAVSFRPPLLPPAKPGTLDRLHVIWYIRIISLYLKTSKICKLTWVHGTINEVSRLSPTGINLSAISSYVIGVEGIH